MTKDAKRLARLRRLERLRAIAKHAAAAEAANAEGTLLKLRDLSERTRSLADGYSLKAGLENAAQLRRTSMFLHGLNDLSEVANRDAEQARQVADARQADLAAAERRRSAVEQRAENLSREIDKAARVIPLDPRRSIGTGLE